MERLCGATGRGLCTIPTKVCKQEENECVGERWCTQLFMGLRHSPEQRIAPRQEVKGFKVNSWLWPWLPVFSRVPQEGNNSTQCRVSIHMVKSLKLIKWEYSIFFFFFLNLVRPQKFCELEKRTAFVKQPLLKQLVSPPLRSFDLHLPHRC